jgi:hypothetical protein
MSPPREGNIVSDSNAMIIYSPLKSWSGTETFGIQLGMVEAA